MQYLVKIYRSPDHTDNADQSNLFEPIDNEEADDVEEEDPDEELTEIVDEDDETDTDSAEILPMADDVEDEELPIEEDDEAK